MVEGIWSETAHGVLAGEPKSYKSVIATDLAVSVASGTPFLGAFKIPRTGPVIMIQEENDPGEMQDRLRRIAFSRGLAGGAELKRGSLSISGDTALPIFLRNNMGFNLTSPRDMKRLIASCKKLQPALLILDPFYLMTPGIDENSAHAVAPILKNLLKIKQALDVGILLIHHYKKQSAMNPIYGAARMSGTGVFHRWFESAVYVEKFDERRPFTVKLLPDHRGHAPRGAITVTFDLGTDEDLYYNAKVKHAKSDAVVLHQRLSDLLDDKDEWKLEELRIAMGMSSTKNLRQMLADHGYVVHKRKTGHRGRPALVVSRND